MSLEHVQESSFCGFLPISYQSPKSLSLSPAAIASILGHCGSVKCGGVFALREWHTQAGDCHVEMLSCHCCFQLVARANSSLHTFKQEDGVLLASDQPSGILPSFVFHWNNSCGMEREVTPSFLVMFPVQ